MIRNLLVISLSAAALSSCIISSNNIVPDMPHNAMWRQRAQQEALAARAFLPADRQASIPTTPTATAIEPVVQPVAQPAAKPTAVTPTPVAVTPKPVTTVNTPAAKPAGNHITQAPAANPAKKAAAPLVKPEPVPVATTPKPAATPAVTAPTPTPTVTPTPTAAAEPKKDNSHIPYAVRVPGDPTRVYNPLAPDLTIRTINPATGEPLPKDTVLRVRGTDKEFRVPAW